MCPQTVFLNRDSLFHESLQSPETAARQPQLAHANTYRGPGGRSISQLKCSGTGLKWKQVCQMMETKPQLSWHCGLWGEGGEYLILHLHRKPSLWITPSGTRIHFNCFPYKRTHLQLMQKQTSHIMNSPWDIKLKCSVDFTVSEMCVWV